MFLFKSTTIIYYSCFFLKLVANGKIKTQTTNQNSFHSKTIVRTFFTKLQVNRH
jgi:hypothetical protein